MNKNYNEEINSKTYENNINCKIDFQVFEVVQTEPKFIDLNYQYSNKNINIKQEINKIIISISDEIKEKSIEFGTFNID